MAKKKIKVQLKKQYGRYLRLTAPSFSFIIDTDKPIEVTEEEYKRLEAYVDKYVEPKKEMKREDKISYGDVIGE